LGPAVHIEKLSKRFGDFTAVADLNLDVQAGEIFGFLGPNGAGKSTTIRVLCGLMAPTSGRALVGGFDVSLQPEEVKRRIGYMSQKFSLYDDMTVKENIEFCGGVYGVSADKFPARLEFVLKMAELEDKRDTLTRLLSGGWKQRLALGCAILHEPPIYCHRIALMYGGRMIALGSPAELKRSLGEGHLLNLESSDLLESLTLLYGGDNILDVAVFGGGLHVKVDNADRAIAWIRQTLAHAGIEISVLEPITPSMEDVFVSLIEQEEKAAA
jgi:ABC-2 type transport system ATP-binding protein